MLLVVVVHRLVVRMVQLLLLLLMVMQALLLLLLLLWMLLLLHRYSRMHIGAAAWRSRRPYHSARPRHGISHLVHVDRPPLVAVSHIAARHGPDRWCWASVLLLLRIAHGVLYDTLAGGGVNYRPAGLLLPQQLHWPLRPQVHRHSLS